MDGLRRAAERDDRDGLHFGRAERRGDLRLWRQGGNRRHLQHLLLQHGAGGRRKKKKVDLFK